MRPLPADLAFLGARYGVPAERITPLRAGEWSRAYALVIGGRAVVARFGRYGADFAKDARMARHATPTLPIPAVLEVGEAADGYFAVSERASGVALDDLDERALRAVLPRLFDALAALRDVDVSDTSGYGIWSPDGTAPYATWPDALLAIEHETPRIPGWRRALAGSSLGTAPFDTGLARLAELAPRLPADRHVVHGDLLNRNVLVDGGRVSAVLDWGNALFGDWRYDLAWLIHWWPWYPAWAAIDIAAELAARFGDVDPDTLLAYRLHIGLDALAYCAFRGRWRDAADMAAVLTRLARV